MCTPEDFLPVSVILKLTCQFRELVYPVKRNTAERIFACHSTSSNESTVKPTDIELK